MSYSFSGSGATGVSAYVSTQLEVAAALHGEFTLGTEHDPVLVFEDAGNQLAYMIEGTLDEMLALVNQARAAILAKMPWPEHPQVQDLHGLPPGSVVTSPFPDIESNVAEQTSDGHWLVTGEERLLTTSELGAWADAPFQILRYGYGAEQS